MAEVVNNNNYEKETLPPSPRGKSKEVRRRKYEAS